MKIASFIHDNVETYGIVRGDHLYAASLKFREQFKTLKDVLTQQALKELEDDTLHSDPIDATQIEYSLPIPNAARIICVGLNFPKRYPVDGKQVTPQNIILFAKIPGTLIGHGGTLEMPRGDAARSFDYEGEIAAVIGKRIRYVARDQALEAVAGYTLFNDGSVRDWQKHSVHAGKNFFRSGACGPFIVTCDELGDIGDLTLTTRLNGIVVQQSKLSEMFYSVADVISYVSHMIPLEPGDIIAMGSPDGSGGSQIPPRFLQRGDLIEIDIERLGCLTNRVGR